MYHNPPVPSLGRRIGISVCLGVIIAVIGSTLTTILVFVPLHDEGTRQRPQFRAEVAARQVGRPDRAGSWLSITPIEAV